MSGPIYAHRASKEVTRRILVDMLHRALPPEDLSSYQYVGFGAIDFIDFDLVHRRFGIEKMTSIENDSNIERYEANAPYKCISVLGGNSTDMLTRVKWDGLSIVWLDYECQLVDTVFSDIDYLCTKLTPGSVLAVTLNCDPGRLAGRRDAFEKNVGAFRVPPGVNDDTLGGWGLAAAQQQILFSTLRRNLGRRPDQATWWQTLNINYRDNARMQLLAGVLCTPAIKSSLESRRLDLVDYYTPGPAARVIQIPYLTSREQLQLRAKLPRTPRQRLSLRGVAKSEIAQYAENYQWIES